MGKNIDLRVVKTKKVLYESLVSLLNEKTFEEIKVSDICERSLINRSTFYSHYSDKYDLLSAFINDLKIGLANELEKNTNISNTKEYYIEMINLFLNHVENKKVILSSIMINNRNSIIIDMIYEVISNDINKHLEKDNKKETIPNDIVSRFYVGAVFNVGIAWLQNNNKYTKQELINYLDKLIPNKI